MRLAGVNDNIFDLLMNEDDKITFNLFELIRENPNSFIATDDKCYIYAEHSRRAPKWLFIKEKPTDKTFDELVALVSNMAKLNALFKINASDEYARPIMDAVAKTCGIEYTAEISMEAYVCRKIIDIPSPDGGIVAPREEHRQILKDFIVGMIRDSAGLVFGDDDSEKVTSAMLSTNTLSLWENDDKKIVSMARIAHKSKSYARINAIFTDTGSRGKDYTKALLSRLSLSLLDEGLIPIIYTDRNEKDKNEAFKKIGFERVGEITTFSFSR